MVELTLHDGLEVGVPVLAADLGHDREVDLAADGELIEVVAVQNDRVILDLAGVAGVAEFAAVDAGTVGLDLHVALADDLAVEGVAVGEGLIHLGDLDLDAAGLETRLDPVLGVLIDDEALGNAPHVVGVVGDDGEAHLNGAGAAGDGDVGHRGVGVDEGEDALEGVLVEAVIVAELDVAEDAAGAADEADDVAHGPDVRAHGDDAHVEVHVEAGFHELVDDAADQEHEDAARLIALDGLNGLLHAGGGADHDREAGDVAGDEGNAQGTHLGVGEVAVVDGALIGVLAAGILAGLDDLGGDGGADAGGEDVLGLVVARHHRAHSGEGGLQLAQGGDLDAEVRVETRQIVGGVGQLHGCVFTQLGNHGVDVGFRLEIHLVGASEYSVKQSHISIPFRYSI